MKTIYLSLILCITPYLLFAQSTNELLLDSTFTRTNHYSVEDGSLQINETFSAYDYDSLQRPVQLRKNDVINNYYYAGDTIVRMVEKMDSDGIWYLDARISEVYASDLIQSNLTESPVGFGFEPNTLTTYLYDAFGRDTAQVTYSLTAGEWKESSKITTGYDANGNMLERSYYHANTPGNLIFNSGIINEYDAQGNLIQYTILNFSPQGMRVLVQGNLSYTPDGNLDTLVLGVPYNGAFLLQWMEFYEYLDTRTTVRFDHIWNGFEWELQGKEIRYSATPYYYHQLDSIIKYSFDPSTQLHSPNLKSYYSLQDLGNGKLYFKLEVWKLIDFDNSWKLQTLDESWYHFKSDLSSLDPALTVEKTDIFPNPAPTGTSIQIKGMQDFHQDTKILIFDDTGRLVLQQKNDSNRQLVAPQIPGMYSVLVKEGNNIKKYSKLVVVQ